MNSALQKTSLSDRSQSGLTGDDPAIVLAGLAGLEAKQCIGRAKPEQAGQ